MSCGDPGLGFPSLQYRKSPNIPEKMNMKPVERANQKCLAEGVETSSCYVSNPEIGSSHTSPQKVSDGEINVEM